MYIILIAMHIVPLILVTVLFQKQALCVVDKITPANEEVIRYFNKDLLPVEARERFTKMFTVKPKWTFEELEPYIRCVVDNVNDVTN